MVLKNFLAWLRYRSRTQSPAADGYITMIYLGKNRSVVVHDSLSVPEDTFIAGIELNKLNVVEGFEYVVPRIESIALINPATGLLMMNEHIDVGGNFFGFGDDRGQFANVGGDLRASACSGSHWSLP